MAPRRKIIGPKLQNRYRSLSNVIVNQIDDLIAKRSYKKASVRVADALAAELKLRPTRYRKLILNHLQKRVGLASIPPTPAQHFVPSGSASAVLEAAISLFSEKLPSDDGSSSEEDLNGGDPIMNEMLRRVKKRSKRAQKVASLNPTASQRFKASFLEIERKMFYYFKTNLKKFVDRAGNVVRFMNNQGYSLDYSWKALKVMSMEDDPIIKISNPNLSLQDILDEDNKSTVSYNLVNRFAFLRNAREYSNLKYYH